MLVTRKLFIISCNHSVTRENKTSKKKRSKKRENQRKYTQIKKIKKVSISTQNLLQVEKEFKQV